MRPLLATCAIILACAATLAQKMPNRNSAGIKGAVRTIRMEGRQLLAVKYHQWGVMVYTVIFDAKGRMIERAEYLPGGIPDTKNTSVYDDRGNEIEHAYYTHDELTRRTTTRYDARNRKIEQLTFDPNGKQTSKFIFQYDKRGRRIAIEMLPDGTMQRRDVAVLDRRGNELERTEYSMSGAAAGRYVDTYDAAGNKTSEAHYYKKSGRSHTTKTTYVYDGNGNVMEEAFYRDGALDNKKTYKHDAHGNQTSEVETDSKGQVSGIRNWSYEFDGDDNWTRVVVSERIDKAPDAPLQPTYEYRRILRNVSDATIGLWSAVRKDEVAPVAALLRQGADVNASHPDSGTPLMKAAALGHRNVVQTLLAAGATVDAKDAEEWTALMWAAEQGRIEVLNLLLAAGADPNARNEAGGVPIMPAALNGHTEVLRSLLGKGADVNATADDGSTALMVSALRGHTETLKFLLANGANPNLKTTHGLTALFFAAASRKTEPANALLEKGVDINSRAKGGVTPLMHAVEVSEIGVVQLLIEKGADINAKTDDGRTALSIAVTANRGEVAELLRKAGAK